MAIEFAGCFVYSRSRGHNAVQAAAYRSASRLYDERTGQSFDYSHKPDVVHSEILLPEGADQSFSDRATLWNHIEKIENRRDSQLAKDYILALPKELSLDENKELARRFAEYHFVSKGLVADLNIHDDEGNPHAHIFVTTRRLLGMSFSQKARDLNPEFFAGKVVEKDYWNIKWREFQNLFFEESGLDLFVDPNHLVPTVHRGRKKSDDRADYIDAKNEYRQELSREIALTDPEAVMNQLSQKYMAFSEREIACVLHKATQTAEEFQRAMLKLKTHPNLVSLGPGDDGRERYATRQSIETESRLQDNAERLQKSARHIVTTWKVQDQIAQYNLNEGQANALNHVMLGGDIAIVVGKAGTGKSYLMKAANEVWQQEGYRVLGISVAGIASESLEFESNIQSSTIASFKCRLEKKKLFLDDKDVIVLDEAGMVDAYELNGIVKRVREVGAKLILVGDHNQVQPIGPGAPFRALLEKIGFVELTEIKRQNLAEDRMATTLLSTGKTGEALDIYSQKGQINLSDTSLEAQAVLIHTWGQHLGENPAACLMESIILAHRNEDVKALNLQARDHLVKSGFLKAKGVEVETINGKITLAVGDRILFTENSWKLKVKNGHFATIKSIKGSTISATIIKGQKEREVVFDANEYKHFSYGYAATIYKTQGVTIDNAFVYAGGQYWSRNLIYVALSRHREGVHLFADRETHTDFETLKKHLSRFSIRDSVTDFPFQYALRRGFDPDKLISKCMEALHQAKESIKDKWLFLANYEAYQDRVEKTLKEQAVQHRRADAVLVAQFTDVYHEVGRQWSDMKRELKPGEELANHARFAESYTLIIERNRLAYQISQHPEKYELAMELNGIDLATLKPYVAAHLARERVLKYERLAKEKVSLAAGKIAEGLVLEGKSHGLYMRERGLSWSTVYGLAKEYRKHAFYQKLSDADKRLYHDVTAYQSLNQSVGRSWERVFKKPEDLIAQAHAKKDPVHQQKKIDIAKAFSQKRDELAFKIQANFEAYRPFLEKFKVRIDRLQKAARHFSATKAYDNKVQHFRSLLTRTNSDVKIEQYNVDRISEALINMGEDFYQKVLGDLYSKPKRHGHNIRVGNKGGFSFNVSGSHVGAWHSFETGEGGYPLQLLMNANYGYGLNFEDALKEGARIAGLSDSQAKDITRKQKTAVEIEAEAHTLAQERQKKIETARYYVKTSKPIEGTIAERYLRETRKIEGELTGFRFHTRVKDPETERYYPAALITAKNEQGQITACQTILIDPGTLRKAEVEVPKRTRGIIAGSVALLQKCSSNRVVIAEGPETGASLIKAMPDANIYVTVGNIRNAEHLGWLAKKHNTDTFYFAADNDGANLKPAESLKKAAQILEAQGIKAYKTVPKLSNVEKPDFNDVLIHQGVDGVKAQLNTMSRILNESEKTDLGLVTIAAFTIKEDRVELSSALLKQVDRFFKLQENIDQKVESMTRFIMDGDQNNSEIEKLQVTIDTDKAEKGALSKTLLKEDALWRKVRGMTKETVIMDDVSIEQYKAQTRDNRFEAKALQKLEEDMRVVVHQEEKKLQQSKSQGFRY